MKAFKCDRCGSLYEAYYKQYTLQSGDIKICCSGNGFSFCADNEMLSKMDLCPDCYGELMKWFSRYWDVLERYVE